MNLNEQIISLLNQPLVLTVLFAWTIFWKGRALWKAANKKQLAWFIIFLIVNTMGILEIFYIYYLNRFDLDKGKLLAFIEKKRSFLRQKKKG